MENNDMSWIVRLGDLPHVKKSLEDYEKGLYKVPTRDETEAYMRRECYGLYDDTSNVDEQDRSSWAARKIACRVSSSVVGLSCPTAGYTRFNSSGIIVEIKGVTKILTSAYILGGPSLDVDQPRTVDVLLPTREKIKGFVSYVDKRHNIVLIHAELDGIKSATFHTKLVDLGEEVVAVGHHRSRGIMASRGEINIRGDHLESDDLMSSSCSIGEWGIGGALVDSSGMVIGMNFFSKKCSTPFMPSGLLLKCVEHLLDHGTVIRPWLGLKIRSLNELKLAELNLIYQKFQSDSGVIVKEVVKGSPADEVKIRPGDVIIYCNDIPISSATQFGEVTFGMVESSGTLRNNKKRAMSVEVVVQSVSSGTTDLRRMFVRTSTPVSVSSDSWPLLFK